MADPAADTVTTTCCGLKKAPKKSRRDVRKDHSHVRDNMIMYMDVPANTAVVMHKSRRKAHGADAAALKQGLTACIENAGLATSEGIMYCPWMDDAKIARTKKWGQKDAQEEMFLIIRCLNIDGRGTQCSVPVCAAAIVQQMREKDIIDNAGFARFMTIIQSKVIDIMHTQFDRVVYCPHAGCQGTDGLVLPVPKGMMEVRVMDCVHCASDFCMDCGASPYHYGDSCDEYARNQRLLGQDIEDLPSILAVYKDALECPGCGNAVFKGDGCDHMTCSKCHAHFCWVCGAQGDDQIDVFDGHNIYGSHVHQGNRLCRTSIQRGFTSRADAMRYWRLQHLQAKYPTLNVDDPDVQAFFAQVYDDQTWF